MTARRQRPRVMIERLYLNSRRSLRLEQRASRHPFDNPPT